MAGKKPSTPKADFATLCAVTPKRVFAGKPMLDASCMTPEPQDYKLGIQQLAKPYLAMVAGYESDLRQPSRELAHAVATLRAEEAQSVRAMSAAYREAYRTDPVMALLEKADKVNAYVKKAITYKSDTQNKGVTDHWQRPSETIKTGLGDCEDYVLLKMALLEQLGFPRDKMWLASGALMGSVKPDRSADGHATLVVELGGRPYVLDNFYKTDNGPYGGVVPLAEFYQKTKFAPIVFMNPHEVMGGDYAHLKIDLAAIINKAEDQPTAAPAPAPVTYKPNTP